MFPAAVRSRRLAALVSVAVLSVGATLTVASAAHADDPTVSYDALRTGWDRNEPKLSPSDVSAPDFGKLFATQLDGQVYAQPVISKGVLLAVTENDKAYGLDPATGAVKWSRNVGPAWPASAIGCGDLTPNVGITATPVVDQATGTAYFTAKVNDGATTSTPHWYLHAVDVTTGSERAGFPRSIAGHPSNDPAATFNPATQMQRPGLLLLDGVVYAAFGGHCDIGSYVGYVVGVDAKTGAQTAMWVTRTGGATVKGGGVWQSGGGLVSDGPGRIILATGNGVAPAPGSGTQLQEQLGESVVRLKVNADRSLAAADFFSPVNNTNLDRNDYDLGSGGPMGLPDGSGTSAHPHLLVQVGKDGRVFLLDRDSLGGMGQSAGGGDDVLGISGPYRGVWGHPAFWGGDGGYVYTVTNQGPLRAFQVGVSGAGLPSLSAGGTTETTWGYTSGSPVVTSNGTTSGSALVWAVYAGSATGSGGELRAYDAVPTKGVLNLRYATPIGNASKFAVPATDQGRVYVGTRDGVVYGFGRPTTSALNGVGIDFGKVAVGSTKSATTTVTATKTVTISAISAPSPFAVGPTTLPVTLAAGQSLNIPVSATPTTWGIASGFLKLTTGAGTIPFDLRVNGTQPGLGATPTALAFGDVPTGGNTTLSLTITNTGETATTLTGVVAPGAPYSSSALPAVGAALAPGQSVSVPITFTPTTTGPVSDQLVVTSDTGSVTVPLSANGVAGAPAMSITPTDLNFGTVAIGTSVLKAFDITNTGNLVLTITKAAPPTAPFSVTSPIAEGQQIEPGDSLHVVVQFTPTTAKTSTGSYLITGDDGKGVRTVTFHGAGQWPSMSYLPNPSTGKWKPNGTATQSGGTTTLTPATSFKSGDVVYPVPVTGGAVRAKFTATLGPGTGADGMTFALLDAAKTTSSGLGTYGGALGWAPLPGVAVALDTYQNPGDPSANFIGIATGSNAAHTSLTYAATKAAPTSLRSGSHIVDVLTTPTSIRVTLDGGTPWTVNVAPPKRALLAFTGGTGGRADVHQVSNVTITQTPPIGPIVGVGGKCVDVRGGRAVNATPVQLYTCNGSKAQAWVVGADRTLRSLGMCLDIVNGSRLNGAKVQLYTCNGSGAQHWVPQTNGTLLNPQSGKCLDDPGASTTNGTILQIWTCYGSVNQKWSVPHL